MVGMSSAATAERDLVLVFAGCTGRLSAEMEHAWLVSDTRADAFQAQRARFAFILDAIMPAERARETLSHRVEAKLAHSAMLTTARFGANPRLAALAERQAQMQVRTCDALLLES